MVAAVSVRNLTKRYLLDNGRAVMALDHVDLDIEAGGFLVIMGPNGAGKTTLLRAIEGSIVCDEGAVYIDKAALIHISQDPRSRTFDRLTMAEHFLLSETRGRRPHWLLRGVSRNRRRGFLRTLEQYAMEELVPFLDRPLSELSGGMRQATSILTAFAAGYPPDKVVLLLDEPVASLDVENERKCLDLIALLHKNGAAVLLITHDPSLVSFSKELIIMSRGKIATRKSGNELMNMGSSDVIALLAQIQQEFLLFRDKAVEGAIC